MIKFIKKIITQYHSKCTYELSEEVMLIKLCGTLVFIKHGEAKLLDLFKVIVHMKLHAKHWVQVVHCGFSAPQLREDKDGKILLL